MSDVELPEGFHELIDLPEFMVENVKVVNPNSRGKAVEFLNAVMKAHAMSKISYDRMLIPAGCGVFIDHKPNTPTLDLDLIEKGDSLLYLMDDGDWRLVMPNGHVDVQTQTTEFDNGCTYRGSLPASSDGIRFAREYGYADVILVPEPDVPLYLIASKIGHKGHIKSNPQIVNSIGEVVESTGHTVDKGETNKLKYRLPDSFYDFHIVTTNGLTLAIRPWEGNVDEIAIKFPDRGRSLQDMPDVPYKITGNLRMPLTELSNVHECTICCDRGSTPLLLKYLAQK